MKAMVDEGKLGVRLWVMLRQPNDALAAESREVPDGRLRRRFPHRPRHQAFDRRRARSARRLAARAVLRQARSDSGDNTTTVETIRETAKLALRARLPALRPRHRRPRQPRDAGHLRRGVQGQNRRRRTPLAGRARAAPQPRRHPAIRQARRDRVDARGPLHLGRPLRPRAPRQEARGRRGLRLAEADEVRGARHQRHRRPGRGRRSDRELLRDRDAGS